MQSIEVKDYEGLCRFHDEVFKSLYDNLKSDMEKRKILRNISLCEVQRLYAIISDINPRNQSKRQLIDHIRYFISDMRRAEALRKGL